MSFKGLADRYDATYKELYKLPVKTTDSDEPFLSFRPDDPKRNDTNNDTREFFPGTIVRETLRLARYLKSNRGLMFIIKQAELQTGNTFSETRIFNPLFVSSLIDPFVHISRPLDTAYSQNISTTPGVSPASDGQLGSAGRLQQATKSKVIADRLGASGGTGLLNLLLPGNPLSRAVSGIMSAVSGRGIVGVNDRPELDFQGEYFSVATWRGFSSRGKQGDPLKTIGNRLSHGDLVGAKNALFNGVKQTIAGSAGTLGTNVDTSRSRGTVDGDQQFSGYRYFITRGSDDTATDRYLKDIITFDSVDTGIVGQSRSVPRVHMGNWNVSPKLNKPKTAPIADSTQTVLTTQQQATRKSNDILKNISRVGSFLFGGNAPTTTQKFSPLASVSIGPVDTREPNPGRARMIYPDLALENRYKTLVSQPDINEQIIRYKRTYTPTDIGRRERGTAEDRVYGVGQKLVGFGGGLKPDYQENTDSLTANGSIRQSPAYVIWDPINQINPTFPNDGTDVSADAMNQLRDQGGNLIDFLFYDFGNSTILPFRAMLTDINESTTPNFTEQQYIGRIERNIVYVGVLREASFVFRIQAFSKDEMKNVWTKINYLTGLLYPSSYSGGFLVPPLVKLTVGNIYRDQPGYIKSMTYKLDDDNWEIDVGNQVPMGITVSVAFSIIEKKQMSTGTTFYPYGIDADVSGSSITSAVRSIGTPPSVFDIVPTQLPNISVG